MSDNELKMPKFDRESEEADWWFKNQDFALKALQRAKAEGTLGTGSVARNIARQQAAKSTTIRLDERDISMAKTQAEQKGLRYQTYLKMLIHEALQRENSAEQDLPPKKRMSSPQRTKSTSVRAATKTK